MSKRDELAVFAGFGSWIEDSRLVILGYKNKGDVKRGGRERRKVF
jgi:hypothetical protein